jgi:hypothetical protein
MNLPMNGMTVPVPRCDERGNHVVSFNGNLSSSAALWANCAAFHRHFPGAGARSNVFNPDGGEANPTVASSRRVSFYNWDYEVYKLGFKV